MNYTIGEFAAILGVTPDTLRLYEKQGIIKPRIDDKNNYRYYNDFDARSLLMSRWYRSMRISLQDVTLLTKNSSVEDIINKVQETQDKLEDEIKKSIMLLNKIKELNYEFKEIKSTLNQCTLKKIPGVYRLKQTNGNMLLNDDSLRSLVSAWMNTLPYAYYSYRIDYKKILSKENYLELNWGLAINEDEIDKTGLKIDHNIQYIKPQTCISAVILATDDEYMMKDSLAQMIDYVKKNNYSISGDIIGKIILTEIIEGEKKSYLETNIPI
ncbi:MerR family DNA-binding transcriptional regulator [Alkalibaculum sp. M08DMB]|uniref:MerR family DNA-binding transcriptional regulator n=1 Tax=Alkalibaculum sporogenes TaxID=2655001 RepID=A0A6A7K5C2_9FIRM|nr:MerR family DNA-binding transcriptional regulator [Alkalibaculum sporogenes]